MPMVRSISLRKKALPGRITQHAKLRWPVNDWTSFNVTFFLLRKSEIRSSDFKMFSAGKRASNWMVSNGIPANDKIVAGPQVFSGAMGMPRWPHRSTNRLSCRWHMSWEAAIINKSSIRWIIWLMCNLIWAIHSKAELNNSKVWHVLEQPMGMHLLITPFHTQQIIISRMNRNNSEGIFDVCFTQKAPCANCSDMPNGTCDSWIADTRNSGEIPSLLEEPLG